MFGRVANGEFEPYTAIKGQGKVIECIETDTKKGKRWVGRIVDKEGCCHFISLVPLEKGKCYAVSGMVVYTDKVKLVIDFAKEIEPIPDEKLAEVVEQAVILEIDKDERVRLVNYCPKCGAKVEEKKTKKGLIYRCEKCGDFSPEEVDTKIYVAGRMHTGVNTETVFIPHKVIVENVPNIMEILDTEGEDEVIKAIKNKFSGKSFVVEGFKRDEDSDFIITSLREV